ncbi:hypothetical protein FB451DRAFT_1258622 [Mycena latifolia]|nr:hypothetical protein FB451DRAFT_1258622 [Mycena latifolia]
MAAIAKLPFLLVGAVVFDRSAVPPTHETTPRERMRADPLVGWYEALMARPILPLWSRAVHCAFMITEAAAILSSDPKRSSSPSLTGTFVLGICLLIAGASIRLRCFHELGRQFTFALTLRDDHALVTTGPYAVVRHPAYTGGIMKLAGAELVLLGPGSWWWGAGYATPWGAFLAFNLIGCATIFMYACTRGSKEDAYLAKTFGEKWERFARDVPYRYIPRIY